MHITHCTENRLSPTTGMAQCLEEMQNNYCSGIKRTTGHGEEYSSNNINKNEKGEQGGKALLHISEYMQKKDVTSMVRKKQA